MMMMLMIVEGTFFSRHVWVSGCGVAWRIYLPFKTIDARIVATTLLPPPLLLLPLLVAKDKKTEKYDAEFFKPKTKKCLYKSICSKEFVDLLVVARKRLLSQRLPSSPHYFGILLLDIHIFSLGIVTNFRVR